MVNSDFGLALRMLCIHQHDPVLAEIFKWQPQADMFELVDSRQKRILFRGTKEEFDNLGGEPFGERYAQWCLAWLPGKKFVRYDIDENVWAIGSYGNHKQVLPKEVFNSFEKLPHWFQNMASNRWSDTFIPLMVQ